MHEKLLICAVSCTKQEVTLSVSAHRLLLSICTLLIWSRPHRSSVAGWTEFSPPAAVELLKSGKVIICQKLIAIHGSVQPLKLCRLCCAPTSCEMRTIGTARVRADLPKTFVSPEAYSFNLQKLNKINKKTKWGFHGYDVNHAVMSHCSYCHSPRSLTPWLICS